VYATRSVPPPPDALLVGDDDALPLGVDALPLGVDELALGVDELPLEQAARARVETTARTAVRPRPRPNRREVGALVLTLMDDSFSHRCYRDANASTRIKARTMSSSCGAHRSDAGCAPSA
jgi:hypothetical protein